MPTFIRNKRKASAISERLNFPKFIVLNTFIYGTDETEINFVSPKQSDVTVTSATRI
jgi:hypothetical protein